jgi:hypothetical protein
MVPRMRLGNMKMLCEKNIHIFFNILEILLMPCESFTEDSENIRGVDCNIPKDEPCCNHVL